MSNFNGGTFCLDFTGTFYRCLYGQPFWPFKFCFKQMPEVRKPVIDLFAQLGVREKALLPPFAGCFCRNVEQFCKVLVVEVLVGEPVLVHFCKQVAHLVEHLQNEVGMFFWMHGMDKDTD